MKIYIFLISHFRTFTRFLLNFCGISEKYLHKKNVFFSIFDFQIRVRNALPPSINSSPSIASGKKSVFVLFILFSNRLIFDFVDTTTATYTLREPYRSSLRKLSDSNEENKSDGYNSIKENGEKKASTTNSTSSYRTEGELGGLLFMLAEPQPMVPQDLT